MARYIDADTLKTDILMKYKGNWEVPCLPEDRIIQRVVTDLRVLIEQSITTDVAPKSEVAREIFEEIEEIAIEHEMFGRIVLMIGQGTLAELKKKYTGEDGK